ncbi:siderophore-interacting protein [Glutamicibacter sp.]|uniref:siderophore-interacting protein n=1 Tax=Glutamicibacter sp. TaxID=1931995 RepID=UPI0028BE7C2B|nr:siderophore-interacting protein [Glutamicibacter sp.]
MANWQRAMMKVMRIKNYPVTVSSFEDLADSYRRITFHSPQAVEALEGFPTEWVRIWVPKLGAVDGRIVQRGYTVTALRKELDEFDLEFVLHEIPGAAGDWAKGVSPGYEMEISLTPARPKIPAKCEHLVLAGDLTALPAINSWLSYADELDTPKITVLLEDAHGSTRGFPQQEHAKLDTWTWVSPTPVLGTALAEELEQILRKESDVYVWGAGEKELVKRLRTVIKAHELPKEAYFTQFYWILGRAFA